MPPTPPRDRLPSMLPTTVVGSYPQPNWLVDRGLLATGVPRARMAGLWRVPQPFLAEAQDDATILAIRDMERAGIDIITDGEIRRESYSNHFAIALAGISVDPPGFIETRSGPIAVPRVVAAIRRSRAVEVDGLRFLCANTERVAKVTLPGPFTMAQQAKDEFYGDQEELVMAFADALNMEAHELVAAGADVIQLDEPWVRNNPAAARRLAVPAINRALHGITVPTVVHLCFGYAAIVPGDSKPSAYSFLAELAGCCATTLSIEAAQPQLDLGVLRDLAPKNVMLGVLDLNNPEPEAARTVAERLRAALEFVPPEKLVAAPDCGMKYLPRAIAFAKLQSLAAGASIVRREIS